jgi:hypothetical protein
MHSSSVNVDSNDSKRSSARRAHRRRHARPVQREVVSCPQAARFMLDRAARRARLRAGSAIAPGYRLFAFQLAIQLKCGFRIGGLAEADCSSLGTSSGVCGDLGLLWQARPWLTMIERAVAEIELARPRLADRIGPTARLGGFGPLERRARHAYPPSITSHAVGIDSACGSPIGSTGGPCNAHWPHSGAVVRAVIVLPVSCSREWTLRMSSTAHVRSQWMRQQGSVARLADPRTCADPPARSAASSPGESTTVSSTGIRFPDVSTRCHLEADTQELDRAGHVGSLTKAASMQWTGHPPRSGVRDRRRPAHAGRRSASAAAEQPDSREGVLEIGPATRDGS